MPLPTAAELTDPTATNTQMKQRLGQLAENVMSKEETVIVLSKAGLFLEIQFTLANLVDGTSINAETGAIVTGASWKTSDFIKVSTGDVVTVKAVSNSASNSNIVFYDDVKNFIIGDVCSTDSTVKTKTFNVLQDGFIKLSTRIAISTEFSASITTTSKLAKNDDLQSVAEDVKEMQRTLTTSYDSSILTIQNWLNENGVAAYHVNWKCSDFIKVSKDQTISLTAVADRIGTKNICFYDENKVFISADVTTINNVIATKTFIAPANGFIRVASLVATSTEFSLDTVSMYAQKTQVDEVAASLSVISNELASIKSTRSDGRTLTRIKAKIAQIKTGVANAQARIAFTGDSWTEFHHIPTQLKNIMSQHGLNMSGTGWIGNNVNSQNMDAVTRESAGTWTRYDINETTSLPTNGCGVDGVAYTSSQAGAKNTYGNIVNASTLRLFYGNSDGVFKYKLNNGEAITITSASANPTYSYVDITGLSASNTLEIEVISGTVTLHGLHARKTDSGIEINKIGNGSTKGVDWIKVSPTIQTAFAPYLSLDLLIVILGTNDYRNASGTVASFKEGITKNVQGHRSANPDVGVIIVAPPRTNGTAVVPLVQYRDAVIELSKELGCEYYDAYDDFNTYAIENTNGQFADAVHLNDAGAYRLAKKIYSLIDS